MRLSFWQCAACFTLPALAYFCLSGLIAFALTSRLSPWLAVPLGLVFGAVILAVWIAGQGGASTVVELNIASAILLILLSLLVPVFIKARHTRLHPHHRTLNPPAAHSMVPQERTFP